jgi:hypothetical protein
MFHDMKNIRINYLISVQFAHLRAKYETPASKLRPDPYVNILHANAGMGLDRKLARQYQLYKLRASLYGLKVNNMQKMDELVHLCQVNLSHYSLIHMLQTRFSMSLIFFK